MYINNGIANILIPRQTIIETIQINTKMQQKISLHIFQCLLIQESASTTIGVDFNIK